ncbi:MAG: hypothetical protein CVU51_01860 [Deltaproteobacteria bacterium HGW-Deltaproteobacteria-1]|jgi:hypothetical protein|nr:MAG: hypothetical protein CVU51_01860 [Deltaproteobacteria bacterium HGW-Deltaproteobacteria-1]
MAFLLQISNSKSYLWFREHSQQLILIVALAVVLTVNYQLLFTFFWRDDFLHFYQIANWNPLEFIFLPYGNQFFPFRQLIYYCLFKLFGVNSVVYFSIVLLTHVGSTYILYKIIHLLTGKPLLAAAGTMIWAIHPGNYASLAYFPAYGQNLTGFLFLLFLYDLIRIEKDKISLSTITTIRWSIYIIIMATSYGTGLAIACLSPIIIIMILWENGKKWKTAASMLPIIVVILLLFFFKDSIYYYFSGEVYNSTPVALSVALNNYKIILEMFIRMCAYGIYCMVAFPILVLTYNPSGTPQYPLIAFFISIPVVILFIVMFSRSKEYKRHYAVLSILFLGLIGLHAYGRATLYQSFGFPINVASMTFRYYYFIFLLVTLILSLMADELDDIYPKIAKVTVPFVFIIIAISIYPSINLAKIIDVMAAASVNERKLYYETIADIEKTLRAYPTGSSVFIDNTMKNHFSIFLPSSTDFPGKAAVFAIGYPNNTTEGRRVYFIEKDCRVAQDNLAKKNWRISSLMLSACDLKKIRITDDK